MEKPLKELTAQDAPIVYNEYASFNELYQKLMSFLEATESQVLPSQWRGWASLRRNELERYLPAIRKEHSKLCDQLTVCRGKTSQTTMPF
ncbi:hypothetical protein [Cerasicoccus fimbriatus]|uniref:hypothetical protein n=1 Tax=Cerasicoccus fimbriatus TaxID=3014554 RepID=UPI0022B52565|nr:hypothetical protein [Cerasicoccus sp. TK19100]